MHDPDLVPADQVAPADLHAAFTAAFADYLIGPFTLPLDQWPRFTGRQGVDLALSRAALVKEAVFAFALVAPRPGLGTWRLATMGAVPAARGGGSAPRLLDDFIARAAAAGCRQVELECFAQNERALRLYRSRGFETVHELQGYSLAAAGPVAADDGGVEAVSLEEAFAWLDRASTERGDLPLQVTPISLRAQPVPLSALRRGSAQIVFAAAADTVTIHSLVDQEPGQAAAQALVAQLVRQHPGYRITVPQLQRPDLGGRALERLGFQRAPLHQLMMRKGL